MSLVHTCTLDSGEEVAQVHGGTSKPVRRKLHHTSDPIVTASGYPTTSGNCSKKRKIAMAPSPPNYTRSTKSSVRQSATSSHFCSKPTNKSKVAVRKVAKQVEQVPQRKHPTNITPSSWRAGRDVVHKLLGPAKKVTKLPPQEPQDDLVAGDSSSSIASSTGQLDVYLFVCVQVMCVVLV